MSIKKINDALNDKATSSNLIKDANLKKDDVNGLIETKETDKLNKKNREQVVIGTKIDKDYKELLERHFKDYRGINLSNGIRELIFSYMRENKLI